MSSFWSRPQPEPPTARRSEAVELSDRGAALLSSFRLAKQFAAGALISEVDFKELSSNARPGTTVEIAGIRIAMHPHLSAGQVLWTDATGRVLVPPQS